MSNWLEKILSILGKKEKAITRIVFDQYLREHTGVTSEELAQQLYGVPKDDLAKLKNNMKVRGVVSNIRRKIRELPQDGLTEEKRLLIESHRNGDRICRYYPSEILKMDEDNLGHVLTRLIAIRDNYYHKKRVMEKNLQLAQNSLRPAIEMQKEEIAAEVEKKKEEMISLQKKLKQMEEEHEN